MPARMNRDELIALADEADRLLYAITAMPMSNRDGVLVRWRRVNSETASALVDRLRALANGAEQ